MAFCQFLQKSHQLPTRNQLHRTLQTHHHGNHLPKNHTHLRRPVLSHPHKRISLLRTIPGTILEQQRSMPNQNVRETAQQKKVQQPPRTQTISLVFGSLLGHHLLFRLSGNHSDLRTHPLERRKIKHNCTDHQHHLAVCSWL